VIILDTNVLSELMRSDPNPKVFTWLDAQPEHALCTTSVNKAEVLHGIALLPEGRRRSSLAIVAEQVFEEDLDGRVLPFDAAAADHFGDIIAFRRDKGRPIQHFDALIAAIARNTDAQLATRDVDGFADCDLTIINPWNP
jgi:predicted nucleic acid-binding protein